MTRFLKASAAALTVSYATVVLTWFVLHDLYGDTIWWLFLVNTLAFYLFVPLPAVVVMALLSRSRAAWGTVLAPLALGLFLFGPIFMPKAHVASASHGPTLRVMTFNMLGYNRHPDGVAAALARSGADVIGIQELNRAAAQAIRRRLREVFPYQALDPGDDATGMGILSRYPMRSTGERLPGWWQGSPQMMRLVVDGRDVLMLNIHPVSTLLSQAQIERETAERAQDARAVVAFVRRHDDTPLIVTTDFNVTDQNTPYAIVRAALGDAWREAGWGLGGTFPGADSYMSSRPRVYGVLAPLWLVRIDYVFHSRRWRAVEAHIGPWDGVSDHRPVVATLRLQGQG